jgi:hypothetical protein
MHARFSDRPFPILVRNFAAHHSKNVLRTPSSRMLLSVIRPIG